MLFGLLLTRVIRPEIAAIKTLIGVMICVVLYITARRAGWGKLPLEEQDRPSRLQLVLMLGVPGMSEMPDQDRHRQSGQ